MSIVLSILIGVVSLAVCTYSASTLGPGLWSVLFAVLGLFMLVASFLRPLDTAAIIIGRCMGVLSLVGLGMLLVASTAGGSPHMSESNEVLAFGMALIAFLGLGFFVVRLPGAAAQFEQEPD